MSLWTPIYKQSRDPALPKTLAQIVLVEKDRQAEQTKILEYRLTNIFLPNMHSFSTHGKSNIHAIIDEKWYIEPRSHLM